MLPFTQAGHTVATNGGILIRVRGQHFDAKPLDKPDIEKLFERAATGEYSEIPTIEDRAEMECTLCLGYGLHSCKDCGEEHDCGGCDGQGVLEESFRVEMGPRKYEDSKLRLISSLPRARMSNSGEPSQPAHFIFEGGDGLCAPTSRD
jgi:hypothetical protein